MDITKLDFNAFKEIGRDWALLSAGNEEKCNTMTVSWGGVGVLWGKDVTFVFVRQSRYTKEFIDNNECFSLAFPGEEYKTAMSFCGSKSGRDYDKWAETGLTPAFSEGVPYPAEAKKVFICRKLAQFPIAKEGFIDSGIYPKWYSDDNMHTMYVGEIIDTIVGD